MTNKPDTLPEGRGDLSAGASAVADQALVNDAPTGHRPTGFDPSRVDEYLELAGGLEHASRVAWRWLSSDESPWEREMTLLMVERLSRAAREIRDAVRDSDEHRNGEDRNGLSGEAMPARPEGIAHD